MSKIKHPILVLLTSACASLCTPSSIVAQEPAEKPDNKPDLHITTPFPVNCSASRFQNGRFLIQNDQLPDITFRLERTKSNTIEGTVYMNDYTRLSVETQSQTEHFIEPILAETLSAVKKACRDKNKDTVAIEFTNEAPPSIKNDPYRYDKTTKPRKAPLQLTFNGKAGTAFTWG